MNRRRYCTDTVLSAFFVDLVAAVAPHCGTRKLAVLCHVVLCLIFLVLKEHQQLQQAAAAIQRRLTAACCCTVVVLYIALPGLTLPTTRLAQRITRIHA